ncbi:MAG: ferrous iron transport protein B [Crocinitomicaceae bacterium]|nr:ferrous iron transport protein B [Crocinitomicaceae bacterium]
MKEVRKIALIGNPNTGKTSLFNLLTGLNQHVGNFPGVTVDKKTGSFQNGGHEVQVLDLPGTYSVFPRSEDEKVVYRILNDSSHKDYPEVLVVVADASNLERNLLLFTQLYDMGLPIVLALTMRDIAKQKGIAVDLAKFAEKFPDAPVVYINGRTGEGLAELKKFIRFVPSVAARRLFYPTKFDELLNNTEAQAADAEKRYEMLRIILPEIEQGKKKNEKENFSNRLDKIMVHPFWGYIIFLGVLLCIFQFIYRIASYPMDWIDGAFLQFSQWTKAHIPPGVFTDLLAEGIIPGIGGVTVFIPQIALLFFFLSLLEETGYMSRVVFIMDKLVRRFGLNGRSIVPLMGSVACAIPGIMATRNINNWKDRIITIMVAPLMSCSARIPVYTLLIALVVPNESIAGFDLRGLFLFGLYALGLISALLVAWVMKIFIPSTEKSFLIMEMPVYRFPRWKQISIGLWEKTRVFIFDAGKIILAISVILWALASYGPPDRMDSAIKELDEAVQQGAISTDDYEKMQGTVKLENSFIGIVGHSIEPIIKPLGYDWKMGIALITSFAAREVFVGSMATIYSVGEDFENNRSLLDRMKEEKNPLTGERVYTFASGASLMIFYVFAMQCMATFAVVKRETNSWKWPLIQMTYMGILAYAGAFITFHIFN